MTGGARDVSGFKSKLGRVESDALSDIKFYECNSDYTSELGAM